MRDLGAIGPDELIHLFASLPFALLPAGNKTGDYIMRFNTASLITADELSMTIEGEDLGFRGEGRRSGPGPLELTGHERQRLKDSVRHENGLWKKKYLAPKRQKGLGGGHLKENEIDRTKPCSTGSRN